VGVVDRAEQAGFFTTTLDKMLRWGRSRSLWPVNAGIACCSLEMMTTGAGRYDFDRFGTMFRSSPRQADVLIIPGPITKKMQPIIQRVYNQMAEPRWVIAMGSCAISGGAFADSYNVLPGADTIFPVDVYIPGCPPRPEALLYGCLKLKESIASGTFIGSAARNRTLYVPPELGEEWPEEILREYGALPKEDESPAGMPEEGVPGAAAAPGLDEDVVAALHTGEAHDEG
jgi:NADH-quinone oxidoreductase subunit B